MERRFPRDGEDNNPVDAPCRHCWQHQPLDPARIELKDGRAWHRCTACEEWYLVRWDDAQRVIGSV